MVRVHNKDNIITNWDANETAEMEEPAFLRRLRQQHAGGGGPDRYIAPRNKKTAVDDDEDAPAYVLEGAENETISRQEFQAMASGKGEVEGDGVDEVDPQKSGEELVGEGGIKATLDEQAEGVGRTKKENVTDIGVKGKKRKATKIGGDDETEDKEEKIDDKKGKSKTGGKLKKRVVKLSFDED